MKSYRLLCSILLAFCFICGSGPKVVFSQGTNLGTIRGVVTDASGAVIAGAQVQVTDLETNLARDLTTNSEGSYEATNLKPGSYKVTVTAQGFKTTVVNDIALRGSDVVRADAKLDPSGAQETVTVSTTAPVIETETPTVSNTLNNRQLVELPRDSRDIYQFLYLNPNITQSGEDGSFKFIGAQSYGAAFSLDGQRSNGGIFGEPTASQPSLESIGELTVLSNNFTAEYAGIQNIRVITKRGGKDYHGSLFYNNKNSKLAAWPLDNKIEQSDFVPDINTSRFPTPYFNLNETGGSFSGPVPFSKGKTFFLASYERRWDVSPVSFRSLTVPSQRILNGDFSKLLDANKPLVPAGVTLTPDELARNTTVVGGRRRFISIPERLLNPVTGAIVKAYFPTSNIDSPINPANGRLLNFFRTQNGLATRNLGTIRLDHQLTKSDSVYAVYNVSTADGDIAAVASPFIGLGLRKSDRTNHTLSVSYSRVFSNSLVNEVRGGFNTQDLFRRANQTLGQFLSGVGFDQNDLAAYEAVVGSGVLDLFGQPRIDLLGYATFSDGGRSADRRLDQRLSTFGDTLTWSLGKHTFKGGLDIVHNHARDGFVQNRGSVRGRFQYRSSNSPDNIARLLLGLPADRVNLVDKRRGILDVTNWETGFFIQDDFKLRPRLTLTLGLRYELITPFVDKNDLMVNFDPSFVDSKTGRRGRFVVPSSSVVDKIDPGMVDYGVVMADEVGVGRGLVKTDKNNFAPRLGAAWRVTNNMVLRGGYGVFYPTTAAQGIRDALESAPFNQGLEKRPAGGAPLLGWPGFTHGFSPLTGGALRPRPGPTANAIPFDLRQPRIEQYNVTVERELGWQTGVRLSYLGTRMRGLISGIDLNMLPPNDTPFATHGEDEDGNIVPCDPTGESGIDCAELPSDSARRPFPELGSFLASYGNVGRGRSHAMQVEVTHRFKSGLSFNAAYTLLDQKSDVPDVGNSSLGGQSWNQFAINRDLSRDTFVPRHRFIAYATYDLPFGRGQRFADSIPRWADTAFGGWQLATNMFAKSGTGFTPFWTCNNCDPVWPGNIASDFIEAVGGFGDSSFRARIVGDPNQRGKETDVIYNIEAFAPPSVGSDVFDDASKRNVLDGPGTWAVNLSVKKNFRITERVTLNFGALFDNVFNHPLLSPTDLESDFARVGSFTLEVDQKTGKLLPIKIVDLNPDFGRVNHSFRQEGFDSRRSVRLMLRLTF